MNAEYRSAGLAAKHLQRVEGADPIEMLATSFAEHSEAVEQRLNGAIAHLGDLEQKMARGASFGGARVAKSWGEQFVQSDGLRHFADEHSRPGRYRLDVKSLTSGAASGGALAAPTRDESLALMAPPRLTLRSILPTIQVTGGQVEFARQTARPSAAGMVAEGATKPESSMGFELVTIPTQVVAHWLPASRQIIEDAPQLRDVIDTELRYGLALKEESQILNGDGTGANLSGLIPAATAFADPLSLTLPNRIDTIAAAILQASLAGFPADAIVLHESDWLRMRLLKDECSRYVLGNPQAAVAPNLFGLPVVVSDGMTAGTFLIGNFKIAAAIFDRWAPRVEISTEHSDFFVKNMVAILAEERIALAVKQPRALVTGTFSDSAPDPD